MYGILSGGAGVVATLIHDGFMNPVDGECKISGGSIHVLH